MQPRDAAGRPLPLVAPIAEPYFEAARRGVLLMQHCPRDGFFFYPRAHCPTCLGADWSWREARLEGTLHSFTIDRIGHDPGQRGRVPLVIALVDLADGPRMVGNMVEPPERLRVGMEVRIGFEMADDEPLVRFSP